MNLFKYSYLFTVTNLLMYFLSAIAFFIGIKLRKKHKEISHLYIYSLSSFIQNTILIFFSPGKLFRISISDYIDNISANIFIIIEFICIYLFFSKSKVITGAAQKSLNFIFAIFFFYFSYKIVSVKDFIYSFGSIYFFESCLILVPCFIYIFQLFAKPPTLNLLNEPSFWFTSGILIYLTLTLPFFFIINYFTNYSIDLMINVINFLGYSLIFSFLIRAYLCKPNIKT
jgi:hypothetical protein